MPHALSMPAPGFQAVILCGPGVSFDTFTSRPEESPKALLSIANRPMVWYPLDFCYRMGITKITLISPPASSPAIRAALDTNPHLTSLPSPKPDLLAPQGLDQTTGTAEIFRLSQVRAIIKGDFIVLPCDLVCDLRGEALIEAWMIKQAGLGGATGGEEDEFTGPKMAIGGERGGRRGGLGVWYSTRGDLTTKGEETDFIATSLLPISPVPPPEGSLLTNTFNLVYSLPTDTLNDITEEKKSLPVRHGLIRKHARLKMMSAHRDAHVYIFPYWILDMINRNDHMDNLSEDVIGWWAKAGWQDGLPEKLGLDETLDWSRLRDNEAVPESGVIDGDIDIGSLSSTWSLKSEGTEVHADAPPRSRSGSDVPAAQLKHGEGKSKSSISIPPILAYVHPSGPKTPLIRRVDTASLLLMMSLHLAKLDSIEDVGREAASPLAHAKKVAYPAGIAARCTVLRADCLLAENVTVEERCAIKECVIGANCQIEQGAKLTRCVLMDGVVVGKGSKITGSILGRRSVVGENSTLQDCEVEDNMRVEPKTEAKNEKFKSSEGLEATEEEMKDAFENEDNEVGEGDPTTQGMSLEP